VTYLLVGKRAREMAAAASEYRLEYMENDDAYGLTRRTFSLFAQSDGHLAENVLAGKRHGQEMYGFDYPYLSGQRSEVEDLPVGFPRMDYENGIQYGCVLVPTDGNLPLVHISPRNTRKGFLPTGLETPVDVENKAFRKLFRVWAEDPNLLHELFTPEVVAFLVNTGGRFTFEIHQDAILCLDRKVKAIEFPPLMALVVDLERTIPEFVWAAHPRVMEAPCSPRGAADIAAPLHSMVPENTGSTPPPPPPPPPEPPVNPTEARRPDGRHLTPF